MPVCPGTEEKEEADSKNTGADLQVPACETLPAGVLIYGRNVKTLSTYKLVRWGVEAQLDMQ